MTVLIKGMTLEKFSDCCGEGADYLIGAGRADEIPPHGDLIDRDALTKDLEKRWNINDDQDFCNKEVWHGIEEAPTIIPASKEET